MFPRYPPQDYRVPLSQAQGVDDAPRRAAAELALILPGARVRQK
jgi:hypothetical protein